MAKRAKKSKTEKTQEVSPVMRTEAYYVESSLNGRRLADSRDFEEMHDAVVLSELYQREGREQVKVYRGHFAQ